MTMPVIGSPHAARAPSRASVLSAAILTTLAMLFGTASRAVAQVTPIYRCGNTYSQWPCPGATAVTLDAAPTADDRIRSTRTAAMQTRWADRLQAERVAAERRNRPALVGSLGPVPPSITPRSRRPDPRRTERASRTAGNGDFVAHVPAPPKRWSAPK